MHAPGLGTNFPTDFVIIYTQYLQCHVHACRPAVVYFQFSFQLSLARQLMKKIADDACAVYDFLAFPGWPSTRHCAAGSRSDRNQSRSMRARSTYWRYDSSTESYRSDGSVGEPWYGAVIEVIDLWLWTNWCGPYRRRRSDPVFHYPVSI